MPSGATAIQAGTPATATVLGDLGVSFPVAGLMLYCEMASAVASAT